MKGGGRCSMVQWFNGSINGSGTRQSGSDGIAMISERGQRRKRWTGFCLFDAGG